MGETPFTCDPPMPPLLTDQLVLGLLVPPAPSLHQGVVGRNQAALAAVEDFVGQGVPGQTLLLWGAPGAGKTFWLQAWQRALVQRDEPATYLRLTAQGASPDAGPLASGTATGLTIWEGLEETGEAGRVWLVDDIDAAPAEAQAELFRLLVQLRERGERLLASSQRSPHHMALREDLRTRLGQGLIYELQELSEEEQLAALRAHAHALGWTISAQASDYDRLFGYMLTRLPRNLALLTQLLDATNGRALALRRPVSLPLVKQIFDQSLACAR